MHDFLASLSLSFSLLIIILFTLSHTGSSLGPVFALLKEAHNKQASSSTLAWQNNAAPINLRSYLAPALPLSLLHLMGEKNIASPTPYIIITITITIT